MELGIRWTKMAPLSLMGDKGTKAIPLMVLSTQFEKMIRYPWSTVVEFYMTHYSLGGHVCSDFEVYSTKKSSSVSKYEKCNILIFMILFKLNHRNWANNALDFSTQTKATGWRLCCYLQPTVCSEHFCLDYSKMSASYWLSLTLVGSYPGSQRPVNLFWAWAHTPLIGYCLEIQLRSC